MPRNGSGVYSTPPGTDGISNATIASTPYNINVHDVEQDLNTPRPILAGGTGATNAAQARSNLACEAALQVVTNYDTQVWENGSFIASNTASGAPVAGHYFIGTFYGNDQYSTLQARDLNGTTNFDVYVRTRVAGVWGAWTIENNVSTAGDTMTGDLTIQKSSPTLNLTMTDGNPATIAGNITGPLRQNWAIFIGGFAGPAFDFAIGRYDNSGAYAGTPLTISRATGNVTLESGLACGSATIRQANGALILDKTSASGANILFGQRNEVERWRVLPGNFTAESSGNVGSDFSIERYSDAGAYAGTPLVINRATGAVNLASTVGSTSSTTGALTVAGGLGVNGGLNVALDIFARDIAANRGDGTGVYLFGGTGTKYIYYTGTSFSFTGGPVNVPATTVSTSPTTGALTVAGGLGVGGEAHLKASTSWHAPAAGDFYALVFYNVSAAVVGSIKSSDTVTAFNTSSDLRLKTDLRPFNAGAILDAINVYDFAWKSNGERSYGVAAQEAAEVYPQAVTHDEVNDGWFTDYSKYVPLLLQELKALRARVAMLEAKG